MDTGDLSKWQHDHVFDSGNPHREKRTRWVVALTSTMMLVEILAGWRFNSMAVLADGWHMSTHAAALGITALAYVFARRLSSDTRFAFGTWKIEVLGGFASAVVLAVVAILMAAESVRRLFRPLEVHYDQALVVAVVGLTVNLVSALMLKGDESGGHHHPGHAHGHADLNLRAAYLHVLADAMTSVLAIVALLGGKLQGWAALDPAMGIVGAMLVSTWAYGLLRDTSRVLLDREMDHGVVQEIRDAIETDGDARISDLHVWRVGRERFACVVCVVASEPKTAEEYKALLRPHEELAHVTVEVARCNEHSQRSA